MPSASLAASLVLALVLEPTAPPAESPEDAPSRLVPDMPDPNDPAWTAPPPPPPPPPPPAREPAPEVTRSTAPTATPGATQSPRSAATPSSASSSPPSASPSAPSPPRRIDRRRLVTAGLVTTGVGLGLGVVAYQADRRVDALSGSILAQEALGAPRSEVDRLERERERQRITLVTAAVGAGVLGVTGLTLIAVALLRRGSPSLTRRSPRLRPAPAFVLAF